MNPSRPGVAVSLATVPWPTVSHDGLMSGTLADFPGLWRAWVGYTSLAADVPVRVKVSGSGLFANCIA